MSLLSAIRFWGKSTNQLYPLLRNINCNYRQQLSNTIHNINVLKMPPPTIYRNVDTVLDVLKNYKADNVQAVSSLLAIYNNALKNYQEKGASGAKTFPLIILEGLDGSGKSTVSKKLASRLNASKWWTPPDSIRHIRHLFDDDAELRTAYYALGNYIAALEVAVILKEKPVIMDRYWHSTAAFAIAQAVHDFPDEVKLPLEGDSFYQWPDDLLKPDIVLFLDVTENIRLQRIANRTTNTSQEELLTSSNDFRANIILAYKNMVNPKVVFINGNGYVNSVLKNIYAQIKHLFPLSGDGDAQ